MLTFNQFPLQEEILKNLADAGHFTPTPIQLSSIPLILDGHDLLGIAQTGTGKTGAYSIPLIQHLVQQPKLRKRGEPRVLILSPTRELCTQIHDVLLKFTKKMDIRSCTIFGGVNQSEQVRHLRDGVDIVVATPGRLLDLVEQKKLGLANIQMFILDEADRMLDMGFIDDLEIIVKLLPVKKQTLLFSATIPYEIEDLVSDILINPKKVEVTSRGTISALIDQKLIYCKGNDKFQLLKKILKDEPINRVLVFTQKKIHADHVAQYLANNRIASKTFHGDMKQSERERALLLFKEGSIKILIATDIASRGIDIEGISHVINFDIPLDPDSYVHRIGRTGRSGKEGVAISFCDETEKINLQRIQESVNFILKSEKFVGVFEVLNFKATGLRKVIPPTPGKSQEKTAYLDHSKRQKILQEGEKRVHPGLRNNKNKKRK
jgi:ATP-dependent RNA helicase RhlE